MHVTTYCINCQYRFQTNGVLWRSHCSVTWTSYCAPTWDKTYKRNGCVVGFFCGSLWTESYHCQYLITFSVSVLTSMTVINVPGVQLWIGNAIPRFFPDQRQKLSDVIIIDWLMLSAPIYMCQCSLFCKTQHAVSVYLKIKEILLFKFARRYLSGLWYVYASCSQYKIQNAWKNVTSYESIIWIL